MPARILVLAGVNGAGKSSIGGEAIRHDGGDFFNPDSAALSLRAASPRMQLAEANAHAWEMGRRGLERALNQGEFFAFETTLGGTTILNMLMAGGQKGAEIHVWYAGLDSPELHIQRVKSRVKAGGHDIAEDKIRERYGASRSNLIKLLPYLTSLRVFDNSAENDPKKGERPMPILLLHLAAGKVVSHIALDRVPLWVKPILAVALGAGNS